MNYDRILIEFNKNSDLHAIRLIQLARKTISDHPELRSSRRLQPRGDHVELATLQLDHAMERAGLRDWLHTELASKAGPQSVGLKKVIRLA